MRTREVAFSPEAASDLEWLYEMIADASSPERALGYIGRIESFCLGLKIASERGVTRPDIRQGLRIVGFERRVTIAFTATRDLVTILRVFYGGVNWEEKL